ncbi:hypothetical protein OEA41_004268 [Lepraria neglecta]|uniref:Uncharacterized protein n=1 Tax=Lepraria neglecta TaxID=209136 RepID=A0AAD9Z008_9LECA|nr:hypothetical protein OEA41_004268 [Lepraria neglecta]
MQRSPPLKKERPNSPSSDPGRLGYNDYRDLRHASPNQVVAQLKELPNVTTSQAETYKRSLRRMVWLGTQDEPEKQAKLYPDWTEKALVASGWWIHGYDDMTGDQADLHFKRTGHARC